MDKVSVTVGLCVKNCAKTVHDALESIVSQNYPTNLMEIVVVDGKSIDGTLSIIKNYLSKTNIKTSYFSDEGNGLGVARQIVFDQARGKYVIWVDGDIVLPPDYFRRQVEFMESNPKVGATRGNVGFPQDKQSKIAVLEYVSKLHYYNDKRKKTLSTFAGVYRTQAMREVGGFDKSIIGAGEDIDLTTRMRAAGWLLLLNESEFYPKQRQTWKELWEQCQWYGCGGYYITHKSGSFEDFWAKIPPIGLILGLRDFFRAYRVAGIKIAFMLPFYRFIKDIAWWFGYVKAYFDHYKPDVRNRRYGHGSKC